jgi:hypothetical protein
MPVSDFDMQTAGDAGVMAFHKRSPVLSNPFNGLLAWAWETGWKEASFVSSQNAKHQG